MSLDAILSNFKYRISGTAVKVILPRFRAYSNACVGVDIIKHCIPGTVPVGLITPTIYNVIPVG